MTLKRFKSKEIDIAIYMFLLARQQEFPRWRGGSYIVKYFYADDMTPHKVIFCSQAVLNVSLYYSDYHVVKNKCA